MNPIIIITAITASLACAALVWFISSGISPQRRDVLVNLSGGSRRNAARNRNAGKTDTSIADSDNPLTETLRRYTPTSVASSLNKLIDKAGAYDKWPMEKVVLAKLVCLLAGAAIGFGMNSMLGGAFGTLLGFALPAVGFFLPDLLLQSNGSKRSKAATQELPDLLDQMVIAVQAGLAFDAAMWYVAERNPGPLAQEMGRAVRDQQIGVRRKDAFLRMADRLGSDDVRSFARAINRAAEHGVAITDVLQFQAEAMRKARRARAKVSASKIPIKVLFPLMVFILPVLFMVVLGPSAIKLMGAT